LIPDLGFGSLLTGLDFSFVLEFYSGFKCADKQYSGWTMSFVPPAHAFWPFAAPETPATRVA
jgi:hypothetical protein